MRKYYHRAKSKFNELSERRMRSRDHSTDYDAIVISYGGSGTTFILKYLSSMYHVNSWDSHNDGIKHANSPLHPIFDNLSIRKAIYIYSDPVQAALSLFRRDFQSHMSRKLTDGSYASLAEYNERTRSPGMSFTLNDMLATKTDLFGINEHWKNWTTKPVACPTLFMRFEKFYENIDSFFGFLELNDRQRAAFPPKRQRQSSISQHDPAIREALYEIYGGTIADMDAREPRFLRV